MKGMDINMEQIIKYSQNEFVRIGKEHFECLLGRKSNITDVHSHKSERA